MNALDLTGAAEPLRAELEKAAAGTVKRVLRPSGGSTDEEDWAAAPGLRRLRAFVEAKTVWHPTGV